MHLVKNFKYHKPFREILNFFLILQNLNFQFLVFLIYIKPSKEQSCSSLSLPAYGEFPLDCSNRIGSRCYIGCQRDFELIGDCYRTCCTAGTWTGSEPYCINRNIICPILQINEENSFIEENCPRFAGSRCNVRCSDGITRSLLCQKNGQWNPELSSIPCLRLPAIIISCPPIVQTTNLLLNGECNPSKPTSICYFTCINNSFLNGPNSIQCLPSGQWSNNQPSCIQVTTQMTTQRPVYSTCLNQPPSIENMGLFQGTCSPGFLNQPCIYTCSPGYALAGNPAMICSENGIWQGSIPSCVQIYCKGLTNPINGRVSKNCLNTTQTIPIGHMCSFTCENNYELKGDKVVICLQTGQWSSKQPSCEQVTCPVLHAPQNAILEGNCSPGLAGSSCKMTCPVGFVITGNNEATCSQDGTWSNSLGVCDQKLCGSLPSIVNGTLSGVCLTSQRIKPGQMCAYQCNSNFQLTGTAILECLDTGLWSNSVPSCIPSPLAKCAPLPIISCATMSGVCTDAVAGQICRYICTSSENCSGSVELTCNEDGTWSGGNLPSCESKVNCRSLKIQVGASFLGDCRPGIPGKKCTVNCKSGYRLYTNHKTIICLKSGSWSNSVPRCVQKCYLFCGLPIFNLFKHFTKKTSTNQNLILIKRTPNLEKEDFDKNLKTFKKIDVDKKKIDSKLLINIEKVFLNSIQLTDKSKIICNSSLKNKLYLYKFDYYALTKISKTLNIYSNYKMKLKK